MPEERKKAGEGQGGSGKKRTGRPRWYHKKNKNKQDQNNNGSRDPEDSANRVNNKKSNRQQGNQRRNRQHNGIKSGEVRGMRMHLVDGKLQRAERFVSGFNIQQVMDKSMADSRKEIARIKQEKMTCELCNALIDDMLSAIRHTEGDGVCHFECVQKELAKSEPLADNEKMVYVGNGEFCIVQERRNRGKSYFFLRKRLPWRESEKSKKY